MKTAKIIFNWLRKVKLVCSNLKYGCDTCPFHHKELSYNDCRVKNIIWMLTSRPCDWDIDQIEKEWDE